GGIFGGLGAIAAGELGFIAAVAVGAVGGFVGGFAGTLLNGGSLGDAFKAGVIGGITGAVTAGVTHGIGNIKMGSENIALKAAEYSENPGLYMLHKAAHGAVGGGISEA
ncbi:hypothetical protein MLD52_23460, partial [Puniceicoccaceae bacterium K14]|nr:hypothetical protein [Puniceicoccaceae bacterium K14]